MLHKRHIVETVAHCDNFGNIDTVGARYSLRRHSLGKVYGYGLQKPGVAYIEQHAFAVILIFFVIAANLIRL